MAGALKFFFFSLNWFIRWNFGPLSFFSLNWFGWNFGIRRENSTADDNGGLGAIATDDNGTWEASADGSNITSLVCLGVNGEALGGLVQSIGMYEWVWLAASLGGVGGGLKVLVGGFTTIGELGEVEFGIN